MKLRFEIINLKFEICHLRSAPRWLAGFCTTRRALSVGEGRSAKALEPPTQGRWGRKHAGAEITADLKMQRGKLR